MHVPGGINTSMLGGSGATIAFGTSAVSAGDLTAYTFSALSLGPPRAGKKVVFGIMGSGGTTTVSSVVSGIINGTFVARAQNGNGTVELWQMPISAGAADVVVTWGAGQWRCGIGTWAVNGAGANPVSTASDGDGSNPMTGTLIIPARGVAVGVVFNSNSSTFTWAGLTKNYDEAVEGANVQSGASANFPAALSGFLISATASAASDQALALASWGPR